MLARTASASRLMGGGPPRGGHDTSHPRDMVRRPALSPVSSRRPRCRQDARRDELASWRVQWANRSNQMPRNVSLEPWLLRSVRTTPSPGLLDAAPQAGRPRQPVFVGGTGRSGTTILGELLRRSTAYTLVERELHFHADRGGLADVLAGRIDVPQFVERMRGFWYRRPSPYGDSRGLFWLVPEVALDAMLQRFPDAFERDRARACASLIDQVVENHPVADGRAWIERTPANSQAAPWLLSMFPRSGCRQHRSKRTRRRVIADRAALGTGRHQRLPALVGGAVSAGSRSRAATVATPNLHHRAPRGTRPR